MEGEHYLEYEEEICGENPSTYDKNPSQPMPNPQLSELLEGKHTQENSGLLDSSNTNESTDADQAQPDPINAFRKDKDHRSGDGETVDGGCHCRQLDTNEKNIEDEAQEKKDHRAEGGDVDTRNGRVSCPQLDIPQENNEAVVHERRGEVSRAEDCETDVQNEWISWPRLDIFEENNGEGSFNKLFKSTFYCGSGDGETVDGGCHCRQLDTNEKNIEDEAQERKDHRAEGGDVDTRNGRVSCPQLDIPQENNEAVVHERRGEVSRAEDCETDVQNEWISWPRLDIFEENNENMTKEGKLRGRKFGIIHRSGPRDLMTDIYISGVWEGTKLLMLDSCEFTHPNFNKVTYIRRQDPGYLFTFDNDDFVARVSFNKLEEVDFGGGSAIDIKLNLINKLIFTEIIKDKLSESRNTAYEDFIKVLRKAANETAHNRQSAEDIFQIFIKQRSWTSCSNERISQEIINNRYISESTKRYCRAFLENEKALSKRSKISRTCTFPAMNLIKDLQEICKMGITSHKKALDGKYMKTIFPMGPYSMLDHLSSLKDEVVLFVTSKDIELFGELVSFMHEDPFLEIVSKVWDDFFKSLRKIKLRNEDITLQKYFPLIDPVYFYLSKSFKELGSEISSKMSISIKDFLEITANNFNFPLGDPLELCLLRQCEIIYKLMNYFNPALKSKNAEFPYDFQMKKIVNNPSEQTLKERAMDYFFRIFLNPSKKQDLPEDRLAWAAIIDYTICNLISKDFFDWNALFGYLIDGHKKFLTEIKEVNHESFRILTHSLISFIAHTGPYFSQERAESSKIILEKQIRSILKAIENNEFNNFRDLVSVYYEFWSQGDSVIQNITKKFSFGNFKQDMEEISKVLLKIVETPLCIEVTSEELITYFRSVNDFLHDIDSVKFVWYVKIDNDLIEEDVKLISEYKKSYEVLDPDKFIKRQMSIPRHYIIEIIKELTECVNNSLQEKKWLNGNNLKTTSTLLSEMKRSFIYLKEQPDYKSFEIFKDETVKPFISVIENSLSLEDFEKRIRIVGGSFWYLRKQNEIDVEKALELYQEENDVSDEAINMLRNCYNIYLEKFTSLIQETSETSYEEKISFITQDVQEHLPKANINNWEKSLKQETIPKIIAGLAAVWSLAESKDLEGTGQSLKPHCIQVLCIFRLLSIDENRDEIYKHLVQVLTGQGKSLILGFLSALLALLGKNVRVVCYSKYLATRDEEDFNFLFDIFGIQDKISYGTFQDMTEELLMAEVDGNKFGLRKLIRNRLLNKGQEKYGQLKQKDVSNTVLLIDEVDVFFSKTYYGSTYGACNRIGFSALASLQEMMWDMTIKKCDKSSIKMKIDLIIKEKVETRDTDFIELNKFINLPGEKVLLKVINDEVIEKRMSNLCLFEEQLNNMIEDAILVANGSEKDWFIRKYQLDREGYITCENIEKRYSRNCSYGYKNIFNYFRLKKIDFDHKSYDNYGYLEIDCGKVSYAKLPEKYPIILGVSGTITTLNDYEKTAIEEFYEIKKMSVMPSFFGHTNLKFDKNRDAIIEENEDDWLNIIYSCANNNISRGRSVIIFFVDDIELTKFKDKYFGKFDRLHVLTENTKEELVKKYVDEAGICRTVTLGTAGMGRGTDFKSSAGVERAGGVHVIQSFLSLDPKEEMQIKGRTARKDNQGSYQLVLCREHLGSSGLLSSQEQKVDYDTLDELRISQQAKAGKDLDERIRRSDKNHNTTMSFLESFFH